jgi:hypothetical protein
VGFTEKQRLPGDIVSRRNRPPSRPLPPTAALTAPAVIGHRRGIVFLMVGKEIQVDVEDLERRLRAGGPRTADDVSITTDGRRLNSREAVLEWWAEVEAERAADRLVDRSTESS